MELINLSQQKIIDEFVEKATALSGAEFLQSFLWGEIVSQKGEEIRRVGLEENEQLLAVVTLIKKPLRRGFFYWYVPRGPIFFKTDPTLEDFLFSAIKKLDQRALFVRIEPLEKINQSSKFLICPTINLQPRKTLFLDLQKKPEKLLAEMHPKTRYNIRLAEKKGVKIIEGGLKDLSEFWRLMTLTGQRDNFRLHSAAHYRNLLTAGQGSIRLFFARYQQQNIATALVASWGNKVTYLHGASDNQFRNVMAPYLLQWTIIRQAQAAGHRYYDFFGIDQKKWPGVTRFKLGFGGEVRRYAGTYDVVFRPISYRIYQIIRLVRRLFG